MSQSVQFIQSIPRTNGYSFRAIHPATGKAQNLYTTELDSGLAWLGNLNQQGYGAFIMVNDTTGTTKADVTGVSAVFADIDHPEEVNRANLEALLELLPASMVVKSSTHGKLHYYWVMEAPDSSALSQFDSIQVAIAEFINSDRAVKDVSRIMRVPGFYHTKAEPIETKLLEVTDTRYTLETLVGLLKELGISLQPKAKRVTPKQQPKSVETTPKATPKTPEKAVEAKPSVTHELARTKAEKLIDSVFRSIVTAEEGKRNITLYNKAYSTMWYHSQMLNVYPDVAEYVKSQLLLAGSLAGLTETEAEASFESAFKGYLAAMESGDYELPQSIGRSAKTQLAVTHHLSELSLNRRTQKVLRAGVEVEVEDMRIDLEAETLEDLDPKAFHSRVKRVAQANSFDPFQDYIASTLTVAPTTLSELSDRVLGTQAQPELIQAYLRCFLVGAVKRVFEPGCKHDTVLVLSGDQGAFKTTFFNTLAGEYFTSLNGEEEPRAKVLQLAHAVIAEMGEIDHAFSKKAQSILKQELSETHDELRTLYTDKVERLPRAFVYAGTTNEKDILLDTTGDRRYHVVELPKGFRIDINWVKANRDAIWSLAYNLYLEGASNYLTDIEEGGRIAHNQQFKAVSVLAERVESLVFQLEDIYQDGFAVQLNTVCATLNLHNPTKSQEKEVANTLVAMGYNNKPKRFSGKLIKAYHKGSNPTFLTASSMVSIQV